ncbi:MAG: Na+/H+ antiporter NhaA, partial [Rickettsiales bacterium]
MKKILSKKILTSFFKSYFVAEFAVGIILIFATIIAILFSNSSNSSLYFDFFNQNFDLKISFLAIDKKLTLRDWINDALMAIFFFLVGLELKSEVIKGELSSKKKLALPLICAVGGVLLPMLLFLIL